MSVASERATAGESATKDETLFLAATYAELAGTRPVLADATGRSGLSISVASAAERLSTVASRESASSASRPPGRPRRRHRHWRKPAPRRSSTRLPSSRSRPARGPGACRRGDRRAGTSAGPGPGPTARGPAGAPCGPRHFPVDRGFTRPEVLPLDAGVGGVALHVDRRGDHLGHLSPPAPHPLVLDGTRNSWRTSLGGRYHRVGSVVSNSAWGRRESATL